MGTIQMGFDPGHAITGRAATGVTLKAGMLVALAEAQTNGNPVIVKPCGASDQPLGLIDADPDVNGLVTIHRVGVGPVLCAANITWGTAVQTASGGRIAPYTSGNRVGLAFTSTVAADTFARVALSI